MKSNKKVEILNNLAKYRKVTTEFQKESLNLVAFLMNAISEKKIDAEISAELVPLIKASIAMSKKYNTTVSENYVSAIDALGKLETKDD